MLLLKIVIKYFIQKNLFFPQLNVNFLTLFWEKAEFVDFKPFSGQSAK